MIYWRQWTSYTKGASSIAISSPKTFWFQGTDRSKLPISARARVNQVWARLAFVPALHLVHFDPMVPFPWVSPHWWLLLRKNGYLERWLHPLLALHTVPSLSRQGRTRPNLHYFLDPGLAQRKSHVRIHQKNQSCSFKFLADCRDRPLDLGSWCAGRLPWPLEENAEPGPIQAYRR